METNIVKTAVPNIRRTHTHTHRKVTCFRSIDCLHFRFGYRYCPENHTTNLQIESCYFLNGHASNVHHQEYPSATGLTLQISCPAITVNINNITVSGNQADNGGNLAINFTYFTGSYYNGSVPSVVINNSRIVDGIGHRGGGLRVWSIIASANKEDGRITNSCILHISNTQFFSKPCSRWRWGSVYQL